MRNSSVEAIVQSGLESYFDGSLDDIAVFDYALTAADIALLYNGYRVLDFQERISFLLQFPVVCSFSSHFAVNLGMSCEVWPLGWLERLQASL